EIFSRNLYIPIIGAFFSIAIVKLAFGGLGCNIWNPALAGRAFILAAWTGLLTGFWPNIEQVKTSPDAPPARTSATVRMERKTLLTDARYGKLPALKGETDSARAIELIEQELVKRKTADAPDGENRGKWYLKLLVGWRDGSLGETCGLWLFIGGIILIALRYIDWRVPVSFIGSAVLLGWALPVKVLPDQAPAMFLGNPIFDLLTGGLLLGASFMATDMVTSPMTKKGAVIFGLGCGILTALIRVYGGYPEGVCYAILLMNTAVPLIDRYTRPRVFGTAKT
ncbi:MAG: RnfABCDGE type electron transport complex subunit D, partial [Planctomycetota bacterium]